MATTIIAGTGPTAAPVSIPNTYAGPITPLTVSAVFNGTSAASAFLPCLSFYSQDGRLLGRYGVENTVAAGDTAEVTFAPFLRRSTGGLIAGGGIPGLLDEQNLAANTSVTATTQAGADTILTGNAITYDGLTTVRFEFNALVQIDMRASTPANSGGFVIFDLWDNGAVANGLLDFSVSGILYVGSFDRTVYFTPSAGSHTFAVKAWRGHGAGVGNPGVTVFADLLPETLAFPTNFALIQINPPPV